MIYGDMLTARMHFFQALGDRVRLEILEHMRKGSGLTVSQLSEKLGKRQNLISHHLSCLKNCGLISYRKDGKNAIYSLKNKRILKIVDMADTHVRGTLETVLSCEVVSGLKKQVLHKIPKSVADNDKRRTVA